jgi:hypothetical protein
MLGRSAGGRCPPRRVRTAAGPNTGRKAPGSSPRKPHRSEPGRPPTASASSSKIGAAAVIFPVPVAGWLRAFRTTDLSRLRRGRQHVRKRFERPWPVLLARSVVHATDMGAKLRHSTVQSGSARVLQLTDLPVHFRAAPARQFQVQLREGYFRQQQGGVNPPRSSRRRVRRS